MKFLTSSQIKGFESEMSDFASSVGLIDNAAHACVKELSELDNICVFCGKGNNGADGYRTAELLKGMGKKVRTVRVFEPESDECVYMASLCENAGVESFTLEEAAQSDWALDYNTAVDAIFGIGIRGEVIGLAKEIICEINKTKAYVLSIDVPSGFDADNGGVCGVCVRADKTVTFTAPKMGMLSPESVELCGEIVIRDVGVPAVWSFVPVEQPDALCAEQAELLLPPRPRFSNKGTFGRAAMIVGSPGMLGAAAIAAKAAIRGGVGLVTVVCAKGLENTMNLLVPEAVVLPLDKYDAGDPRLSETIKRSDALLIGCGLGESVTADFIASVLDKASCPAVIDADGLNTLAGRADILKGRNVVLTPHPLEFSRLTGLSVNEIESGRLDAARKFAVDNGVSLVLKGARSVVAGPDGGTAVCCLSTSALAKAGSGDALAGLICALCAQGLTPEKSARLGVYLHARAGIIAGRRCGEYSTAIEDIIDSFKFAFKEVCSHEQKSLG